MKTVLRSDDGMTVPLDPCRWHRQPTSDEEQVLRQVVGPALDVGCGPGRHVLALAGMGVPALGIDVSPLAVTLARHRGAAVLQRCVFRPLPLHEVWQTVLLLDGNIGIGGCPTALLHRARQLLAPGGRALVEVDPPGAATGRMRVRVERGSVRGPWFTWARVAASCLPELAQAARLDLRTVWESQGRWFARLERPTGSQDDGRRRHLGPEGCDRGAGTGLGTEDWAMALADGA